MSITRINTNTDALMAGANLRKMEFQLSRTMSHLSSGLRIVTAADDPSGMALAASFTAQVRGTVAASGNAQDALSMMQLADSALSETTGILLRMRDLAVRAATDATLTTAQRTTMQTEVTSLRSEITRRSTAISFNTKILFSGGLSGKTVQVGPDNLASNRLSIRIPRVTNSALGIQAFSIGTPAAAQAAIGTIQSGINQLSNLQAAVGVQAQNLERIVTTLGSAEVNMAAAASRITDADMASEITNFARQQVISMAATAMIAQANAQPQQVLQLLQNL